MKTISIYALYEDTEDSIKYIGYTSDPEERLKDHIRQAKHRYHETAKWIKELSLTRQISPKMLILDEVPAEEHSFWEYHYIFLYRSWGFDLTNTVLDPGGYFKYAKHKRSNKPRKPRKYMPSPLRKKIVCIHKDTKEILEFESLAAAGKYFNMSPDRIAGVLNKRKIKQMPRSPGAKITYSTPRTIRGYRVLPG